MAVGRRRLPVRSPRASRRVARWLAGQGSKPAALESYDATTVLRRYHTLGMIAGWRNA